MCHPFDVASFDKPFDMTHGPEFNEGLRTLSPSKCRVNPFDHVVGVTQGMLLGKQ